MQRPQKEESPFVKSAVAIFIAGCFLSVITTIIWFALAALPFALLAGYVDNRLKLRYQRQMETFRKFNAERHANVFECQADQDLLHANGDTVLLYDRISWAFLGAVPKADIALVLEFFAESPDLLQSGDNDIPFSTDELEYFATYSDTQLSDGFCNVVNKVLSTDPSAELVLRWVAQGNSSPA